MRLLIVEDEMDIALPLKGVLDGRGFAVDVAEDGKQGLDLAEINSYDCILLDLNLPEIDGMELATRLRKTKSTPIIMVTARSQLLNKLEGFHEGADDYVTKPFDMEELIARIHAVIKRHSLNKMNALSVAGVTLIPDQNLALVHSSMGGGDTKIDLTTKETGVFEYLLRNTSKIVSAEELLEHVWDEEANLFSDTVKTHIKTLRSKIDPDKSIIHTIRGKGYIIRDS